MLRNALTARFQEEETRAAALDHLKYSVEGEDFGSSSLNDLIGDLDVCVQAMQVPGRAATVDLEV